MLHQSLVTIGGWQKLVRQKFTLPRSVITSLSLAVYFSFFVFASSANAEPAACVSTLGLHGFKAAAQAACGFTQSDNEAIAMAKQCVKEQTANLNLSEIQTGGNTFEHLEQKLGHDAACNDVFVRFSPLFQRASNVPAFKDTKASTATSEPLITSSKVAFRNLLSEGLDLQRAVFHGERGTSFDHNGSQVIVFEKSGLIVYEIPKPSIAGSVRPGDLLFAGTLGGSAAGARGTAFVFKSGCEPASYAVTGRMTFEGYGARNEIILRGRSPVRVENSCAIARYSATSPNAVLRIEFTAGDI
jgi:hypothetical protein